MYTAKDLLEKVDSSKGTSGGWPSNFNYEIGEQEVHIILHRGFKQKDFRQLDPWGLAFADYVQQTLGSKVSRVILGVENSSEEFNAIHFEALLRRVSFLDTIDNGFSFGVKLNGENVSLYEFESLLKRPSNEIIRTNFADRDDKDQPGRIEKDFQTFLFGKGLDRTSRTNERLAVLGEDFFKLNKKNFGLIREFPTGVFDSKISNKTRILPTEFIDIVTINKNGNISIVELKINDTKLEVISQILDYGLFFLCYIDRLLPILEEKFNHKVKSSKICCYVVNNLFHQRFDSVARFYSQPKMPMDFEIKKSILGYTVNI